MCSSSHYSTATSKNFGSTLLRWLDSCNEERRAPLEHAGPLDFKPHVHDSVVGGCHVEHGHGRRSDEWVVERLTAQFADRYLDTRMTVEHVPPERERDIESSP